MTSDSTQDKELLERYRRASDSEAEAPSEAVRAAISPRAGAWPRSAQLERRSTGSIRRGRPPTIRAGKSRHLGPRELQFWPLSCLRPAIGRAPRWRPCMPIARRPRRRPMSQLTSKSEQAPTSRSADAAAAPPLAKVAPAPHGAVSAAAEEPAAPAPRKDLRIVRERPRAESIAPAAAQNYAPTTPPTLPLSAPAASPPALSSGARSMSADRVSASLGPPVAPLLSAVAAGDIAQATGLLDHGAAVDARDELGRTALMLAVALDRPDIIRLMLDRGADPNAVDNAGQTPLQQAKQKNLRDVAALLERAGAR